MRMIIRLIKKYIQLVYQWLYIQLLALGKGDQVTLLKTTIQPGKPKLSKGRVGYIIKPVFMRRKLWYMVDFTDTIRMIEPGRLKRTMRGWVFRLKLRFMSVEDFEKQGEIKWKTSGFDK